MPGVIKLQIVGNFRKNKILTNGSLINGGMFGYMLYNGADSTAIKLKLEVKNLKIVYINDSLFYGWSCMLDTDLSELHIDGYIIQYYRKINCSSRGKFLVTSMEWMELLVIKYSL